MISRGMWLISRYCDRLLASLEARDWVDENGHLSERFEACKDGERPFANKKIMLAPVDDPDADTVSELLSVAGAEVRAFDCDRNLASCLMVIHPGSSIFSCSSRVWTTASSWSEMAKPWLLGRTRRAQKKTRISCGCRALTPSSTSR